MTHIRSTLFAAIISVGSATVVAAQTPVQTPQAHHQHRAAGKARVAVAARKHLFKGITLSDAEKANLKAVREKYASQNKALREQLKPQLQAAREARQRGDTAALRNFRTQALARRDQAKKQLAAERLDLRAALTPANQAKFDANLAQVEKRLAKHAGKAGKPGRAVGLRKSTRG